MVKRDDKRGFELDELGKIIFFVLLLAFLAFVIYLFISGKGSQLLDAVMNAVRKGR